MRTRTARVVASLLVCAAGLVAGDADDVTLTYTYEETAAGRDIHEGIYGSHGAGEFDEWRLHLGVAPAMDRIQLKTQLNGEAYPGPGYVETDRTVSDPPMSPEIGLIWVLGDFEAGDHGWFTTLGFNYTRRDYIILYGLGFESQELDIDALTAHFGMGYAWQLGSRFRFEIEPFVNAGIMWTDVRTVDLQARRPSLEVEAGPVIEGGLRSALVWHPARTQAWHVGLGVDYRTGYAQTIYDQEYEDDTFRSEIRFWWYGFGYTAFYGHKF